MSAVADVLNAAADLIERDGWCQGRFIGGVDGRERCVSQAIFDATLAGPGTVLVFHDARTVFANRIDADTTWAWNDTPGRTRVEVVAALRAAAKDAP